MSQTVSQLIELFSSPESLKGLMHVQQDELLECADEAGALWSLLDHVDIRAEDSRMSGKLVQAANLQAEIESLRDRVVESVSLALEEGVSPVLLLARPWNILGDYYVSVQFLVASEQRYSVEESLLSLGCYEVLEQRQEGVSQLFKYKDKPVQISLLTNLPHFYMRERVDVNKLLVAAGESDAASNLEALSPEDSVLLACLNMFYQDKFDARIGDLVDLGDVVRSHADEEEFWVRLLARGQELSVIRALYLGLYSLRNVLSMDMPEEVTSFLAIAAPAQPGRFMLETSIRKSFVASCDKKEGFGLGLARNLLRVRGCLANKCWSKTAANKHLEEHA